MRQDGTVGPPYKGEDPSYKAASWKGSFRVGGAKGCLLLELPNSEDMTKHKNW
jgi:hypothetical protein